MDDFLEAFNKNNQDNAESGEVTAPFIGDPSLLPLASREELTYRYEYLEETVESLALHYRLAPNSVAIWLKKHNVTRKSLNTEEDIQAFEAHVNKIYKSLQIRILGLTALNTAKAWQTLAISEEGILASLENASKAVAAQEHPDPRTISSLARTHDSLVARHELIQRSMEKAGDVMATLKKHLNWELEVTHVDAKSKGKQVIEEEIEYGEA